MLNKILLPWKADAFVFVKWSIEKKYRVILYQRRSRIIDQKAFRIWAWYFYGDHPETNFYYDKELSSKTLDMAQNECDEALIVLGYTLLAEKYVNLL